MSFKTNGLIPKVEGIHLDIHENKVTSKPEVQQSDSWCSSLMSCLS